MPTARASDTNGPALSGGDASSEHSREQLSRYLGAVHPLLLRPLNGWRCSRRSLARRTARVEWGAGEDERAREWFLDTLQAIGAAAGGDGPSVPPQHRRHEHRRKIGVLLVFTRRPAACRPRDRGSNLGRIPVGGRLIPSAPRRRASHARRTPQAPLKQTEPPAIALQREHAHPASAPLSAAERAALVERLDTKPTKADWALWSSDLEARITDI
jgi:hypothetical protein